MPLFKIPKRETEEILKNETAFSTMFTIPLGKVSKSSDGCWFGNIRGRAISPSKVQFTGAFY